MVVNTTILLPPLEWSTAYVDVSCTADTASHQSSPITPFATMQNLVELCAVQCLLVFLGSRFGKLLGLVSIRKKIREEEIRP